MKIKIKNKKLPKRIVPITSTYNDTREVCALVRNIKITETLCVEIMRRRGMLENKSSLFHAVQQIRLLQTI